jgi:lysophospholipase L1-like esterase
MAIYDSKGQEVTVNVSSGSSGELVRKFVGKNIVWLGDSIHAYTQPDGVSIPYLFEYHSGAKCYNWCQGGTTMALTGVINYDPFSGVGMVDALINRDFTEQETHMTDRNFESQVAEMKALIFSTVDIVVIEFGTNDALKDVVSDNADDIFDTSTTGGALRHMLRTLLTAYPKIQVVVCNVQPDKGWLDAEHTESYDTSKQTEVINKVCDEFNVPLIDIYNELGLNEYTKSTLLHDGLHRSHEGKLKQVRLIENKMIHYF